MLNINRNIILKTIHMKKYLSIIPLAALILAACNKEAPTPTLSLDTTNLEFSAEGGSKTVKLESNTEWTVTTDEQDWYTVSPASGNGNAELTVTLNAHTEAIARSAEVLVEASGLVSTLAIVQNRPVTPNNPAELNYLVRAYEQDFSIPAPAGFTYKTALHGEGVTLVSEDAEKIVLHFDANTGTEYKNAALVVSTTDDIVLETATLKQSWRNIEEGELVIDEVFFTGFKLPDSDNVDSSAGDQYVKLTNTTDETLYADGVMFAISETSSQKSSTGAYWAYPELPDGVGINTLYVIPGNGRDVAIEPGKSLVLAIAAQNFKAENGVGCDLSKADFEFYDVSGNDNFPDTDNPDVENLNNWLKSSWTFTSLHNRGYESYAIALPPYGLTSKTFMENHAWEGQRVMDFNGYHFERDITDAYIIPNGWVLDAVNCAVDEDLATLAFNATVDAGYTNVSTIDSDPERFGKSILRKRDADGKIVDTNNSTNDFEICTSPTMR